MGTTLTYSGGSGATMPDGIRFDTLAESYVSAQDGLVFPNVQTCMALVLRSSPQGKVAGYHSTIATTREELLAVAGVIKAAIGDRFTEFYLLGSVSGRATFQHASAESRFRGPLLSLLREVFGYAGQIRYFDTSAVNTGGWLFTAWRDPQSNLTRLAGGRGGTETTQRAPNSDALRRWRHQNRTIQPGDQPPMGTRIWTAPPSAPILPHSMEVL